MQSLAFGYQQSEKQWISSTTLKGQGTGMGLKMGMGLEMGLVLQ
jgi:hypothetical protein